MKNHLFIVGLLFCMLYSVQAQQTKTGWGVASDSTESNYRNLSEIGGPKTIGAQLVVDNQKKESYFRVPVRVFRSWYDWKAKLMEDTGIQLGINYTGLYMRSSEVIDPDVNTPDTGGGVLDIQAGWNLVNRKSGKNKGTLFVKLNNRHTYGNRTAPMFHGLFESGYYGLPATGYRNYSLRFLEFNWQQNLLNDKLTIVLGKVDPTNYFNFHGLVVPWTSFLGYGSSVSGTINWANQGLGIVAGYKITDQYYIMGGISDVYGDEFSDGQLLDMGSNFFDGNFMKLAEVGFVPSMAERFFKKVSITFWQTDAYVSQGGANIEKAQGIAFSSHWFFQERFAPYVRFAFSNGQGENAFYKKDLQIGHGLVFRSHDLLGTSFSWAEPNIPGTKDQFTFEAYYRFQLTEHLAFTPDFQWIINPSLNPDKNDLTYFGFRGRATF